MTIDLSNFLCLQELNCYLDHLLSEAKSFTEKQILMLVWETIIETSDTTMVSTEWAMYELAKDQERQVITFSFFFITRMSVFYSFPRDGTGSFVPRDC